MEAKGHAGRGRSGARVLQAFVLFVVLAVVATGCAGRKPKIIVGAVTPPPGAAEPADEPGAPEEPLPPELAPEPALGAATSSGPPGAVPFQGAVDVPSDLLFFLVIGSDARPGQDVARSRADSIHVVAVDPVSRRGTVLGIPRDAYVEVPGHGSRKINAALALGGPNLLAETVRRVTGLPVSHYAVTGFEGIVAMVDELGGLDVYVAQRMDDSMSGARFEQGWHHMDGTQVLAFSRNRNVQGGDLTRSRHIGGVILHGLQKARSVITDEWGVRGWLQILYRHARVDLSMEDAVRLGFLARSVDPSEVVNVVTPGRVATIKGQSVVVFEEPAYALFRDVGADAVADGRFERPAPAQDPSTPAPPTPDPGTPAPDATPIPTPTPADTPRPLFPL